MMHREYTRLITASVLAMAATSASGQIQFDSPRQSLQVADRLLQERAGLHSAIAIAETHTNGVAIGVRLVKSRDFFSGQDRTAQDRGAVRGREVEPASDPNATDRQKTARARQNDQPETRPTDRDRQTSQTKTRPTDQWNAESDSLFAIVTCVVDRTKVRDVIVDLESNAVVGVQAARFGNGVQNDLDRRSGDERDFSSDFSASTAGAGGYALATDLMNATVWSTSGEQLGNIDDLAVDPDSNRVVYGVLRRGGFLGMGESRYAIPTSELAVLRNGRIVLDLEPSQLENIAGFENGNWPKEADPKLGLNRTPQATDTPAVKQIAKASDVVGHNVQCQDGHKLGEISDLVVDPRTGRILYAIVNTDRGLMPVPMATLRKSNKIYSLPMTMDQLRTMPVLDPNLDPNWSDENWNRSIHERYGAKFEMASARNGR